MNPAETTWELPHDPSVGLRFSAAAASYDSHATIQKRVARALADDLPALAPTAAVLEVGCGTGQLTELLFHRYPQAAIHLVDIAPRMVEAVRHRFGYRATYAVSDVMHLAPTGPYDLIASSSSLHWTPSIGAALAHMAALLRPAGHLVFAVMLQGTLRELHEARVRVAPAKTPRAALPTTAHVLQAARDAGFQVLAHREESLVESYTSAAAFLKAIHQQGLTGGALSRADRPLHRSELADLRALYDRDYRREDGRVGASYRVLYVQARRAG